MHTHAIVQHHHYPFRELCHHPKLKFPLNNHFTFPLPPVLGHLYSIDGLYEFVYDVI